MGCKAGRKLAVCLREASLILSFAQTENTPAHPVAEFEAALRETGPNRFSVHFGVKEPSISPRTERPRQETGQTQVWTQLVALAGRAILLGLPSAEMRFFSAPITYYLMPLAVVWLYALFGIAYTSRAVEAQVVRLPRRSERESSPN